MLFCRQTVEQVLQNTIPSSLLLLDGMEMILWISTYQQQQICLQSILYVQYSHSRDTLAISSEILWWLIYLQSTSLMSFLLLSEILLFLLSTDNSREMKKLCFPWRSAIQSSLNAWKSLSDMITLWHFPGNGILHHWVHALQAIKSISVIFKLSKTAEIVEIFWMNTFRLI